MKFKIMKSGGKLPVCTFVLIYILPLLVFVQCSALSPSREMRLFGFCWFFLLFQVPLTSCASPWRAGGTRKGASPKYCLYYVTELSVGLKCTLLYLALKGSKLRKMEYKRWTLFHSFQITFAQVFISKRAIMEMHHSLAKQDTIVLNVNFGYPSCERNSSVSRFPDKFTTVSFKKNWLL